MWVVALHLIVAFVHNQAHQQVDVALSTIQTAFALVVVIAAPGVAAATIWRGSPRIGAAMLVISMLASLAFGFINHFVLDTPDQLAHIPTDGWGQIFTVSAYALALTELAGVLAGAAFLRTTGHEQLLTS
jgi:hypothetical protein